jgi:hypothetical protein
LILGQFLPRYEVLAWYIDLNGIKTKIPSNTHTLLEQKKGKILVIDTRIVQKNDTSSTLILLPLSQFSMLDVAIMINNWVIFVPKSMQSFAG